MFSRCLKRSLCVVLSCTVLVFSCFFIPRQRADASFVLPVVGTVAGLFALGLLAYGVSTSADSDFVQDNLGSFSDAIGFISDPFAEIRTKVCASLVLSAALPFAEKAYISGACSTTISGPIKLPDIPSDVLSSLRVSNGVVFSYPYLNNLYYPPDSNTGSFTSGFLRTYKSPSGYYDVLFIANDGLYIASKSSGSYTFESSGYKGICIANGGGGYCRYRSITPENYVTVFNSMYSNWNLNNYNTPFKNADQFFSYMTNLWHHFGATNNFDSVESALNFINSNPTLSAHPGSISADVSAKPVIPGACDVFNSSKSLDSYHVDSPGNDVLDLGNVLEKTGCESIDDVVSKVYEGDLTASDVIGGLDCRPYVDVDVDTGTIAIPNETTNSRPIALDKDLSIPSDIADTDTYEPINPPIDDTNSDRINRPSGSYTFPLSNFFPFCLPWDIYKVLSIFNTSPKAPVISIPLGSFFSDIPGVDSDTTDYICTIDLGDENFKKWFQILRLLESIGIIVGFVLISRYLIHGGD